MYDLDGPRYCEYSGFICVAVAQIKDACLDFEIREGVELVEPFVNGCYISCD